jgi:hypothetical protein
MVDANELERRWLLLNKDIGLRIGPYPWGVRLPPALLSRLGNVVLRRIWRQCRCASGLEHGQTTTIRVVDVAEITDTVWKPTTS